MSNCNVKLETFTIVYWDCGNPSHQPCRHVTEQFHTNERDARECCERRTGKRPLMESTDTV